MRSTGSTKPVWISGRSQADLAQAGEEHAALVPQHPSVGEGDQPSVFAFDRLSIMKVITGLPMVAAGTGWTKPVPKMSGESVEVTAQTVGGESQHAGGGEGESIVLGASAEMKGRNGLTDRVNGEPEPAGGSGLADADEKLVHLDDGQDDVVEQVVMPALAVATHPLEPASERGIRVTGEANENGSIDPIREKPQHKVDFFGAGLEVVERRVDTAGKDLAAGLALEALEAVVGAIAHECMKGVSSVTPQ